MSQSRYLVPAIALAAGAAIYLSQDRSQGRRQQQQQAPPRIRDGRDRANDARDAGFSERLEGVMGVGGVRAGQWQGSENPQNTRVASEEGSGLPSKKKDEEVRQTGL